MTHIIIRKSARELTLHHEDQLLVFPIALGFCPVGHKQREGDGKTPEGEYYVCTRNPESNHHLALGLSYPNIRDAEQALMEKAITDVQYGQIISAQQRGKRPPWDTPLGGFIMIHGGGTEGDWTQGCIAIEDKQMDPLWATCPLGTKVTILP
ncbi:L,D-transpeptidase family protein [Eubacteriales bacterium OttesenSCG-928-N13]|nr:L,D-transpeptidase family protein [Eubacteriales bacterium OttesenSCG-928-N13]